ncbi:MAG: hypothetical protein QOJ63_781, partial [Solirubrobacteraceae bacterium]|nr:hypothetical protein [Solirubrobacteraceae bacterium]
LPEPARARARAKKLFKTLRVSNSNSNYYDNTDERYTTSNDLTAIGAAVRSLRQARGMTLEALADAASMSVTYLSDIERGRSNPTIGKLGDLAIVLEIQVSELIARAEQDQARSTP